MMDFLCPQCHNLLSSDSNKYYCPDCNRRWRFEYRIEELDLLACHVEMTEEERKEYEAVYDIMQKAFDAFIDEHRLRPHYGRMSDQFQNRWRELPKRDDNDGKNYFNRVLLKGIWGDQEEDIIFYRHPDEDDEEYYD